MYWFHAQIQKITSRGPDFFSHHCVSQRAVQAALEKQFDPPWGPYQYLYGNIYQVVIFQEGVGSGPQFVAKIVDPSEAYFYCWFIGLRAGGFIWLYHCFKLRVFVFVCELLSNCLSRV